MLTISDYCIVTQLYESANSLIYRGYRVSDKQPVVLKMLKDAYPIPERIAWFKREYKVTRDLLTIPGVVDAYTLIRDQERLIMVLEDFGGDSLTLLGIAGQLELSAFLKLAIAIAKILGQIHAANIIHKDINPSNIVLNPTIGKVKIIDFGISTVLSQENPTFSNPNILEGTLAYISPEQTGRMNRAIDYRTDFYSLGATFYELLTGILPFESSDALELVHSHIAKQPIPPCELLGAHSHAPLPPIISDIVMKLMAKNAEDRYQSTYGLLVDLETCLHQLQTNGQIDAFPLGQQDISERFQISQKLYGREREIETLLAAFVRVAYPENIGVATTAGRETISQSKITPLASTLVPRATQWLQNLKSKIEMVLVGGYSGVGKSTLVQEAHKPITARRGNFISGKFDQYQRNVPYYAISQAFNDLCNQMLTESEAVLSEWRDKILAAVGNNGQVLIDIIPNLERVIGLQPPVVQVGPSEAQNRFNLVFQNFIQAICQRSHPLVLFIDNLQWADSASLNLLKTIMSDTNIQYLLIIGTYRDNEVDAIHPLAIALEEIKQKQGILSFIHLDNLLPQDVNALTAEALACSPTSTQPLTDLVYEKTQGNPFFTTEFLRSLYTEGLLTFNKPTRKWDWDVRQIQAKDFTDRVVELMASKIAKLNVATQTVLQLAACIGNPFNLSVLGTIYQHQPVEVLADLFPAIQEGLVIPLNNKYKLIEAGDNFAAGEAIFTFLHDRVQQAAYSLIDEAQKTAVHLQIGRLLLQSTPPEELSEKIFEIVDRLNLGLDVETLCITSLHQDERDEIAKLNLIAGQKAKSAMAYEAALKYLNVGLALLAEDSWQTQYDLTRDLYESAVYAEYLSTNYERSQHLSDVVLQQVKTVQEKANVYEIKIQLYIAQNQMQDSVEIGLQFLKMLGISLSHSPPSEVIIDDLDNLPPMSAPDKLAAMRILKAIWSPSHMTNSSLAPSIVFTMVELCLNYGNSSFAAFAYVLYGLLLCRTQSNLDLGYQLGKLSLKMLEQFDASEIKGKVHLMFNCCIRPWKEHKSSTLESLLETLKILIETGDIEYASYAAINYCSNLLLVGKPLDYVKQKYNTYISLIQSMKQDFSLNYVKIWGQLVLNLRENSIESNRLMGEMFNESEMLPILQRKKNSQSLFVIELAKTRLNYLFKKYTSAVKNAENAAANKQSLEGLLASAEHNFYYSLSLLANYPNQNVQERKQYIEQVAVNQKEMKTWADHAPMNFQHNYDLVEAEKARVLEQVFEAMKLYERAIKGARDNGYIQEEALAYELAANFYLAHGIEEFGKLYMTKAHYGYVCWQATAKVKDLEQRYPQFFAQGSSCTGETSFALTTISTTDSNKLDMASVLKASQTLSSEIVLNTLLEKMMKIVLENAGAQKGYLILSKQGQWVIAASGRFDNNEFKVLPFIPIEAVSSSNNIPMVPLSIINYVSRTQESIILNDAMHEGLFTRDPYIVKHLTKSVLCVPLLNQAKLAGFLYLENNLTTGAFTPDRFKVLKLLTTQVLISIENAKLYTNLQDYFEKLKVTNTELLEANKRLEAEITDRKRVESQLHHAAFHDALTGLPNRALFIDRLRSALKQAKQHMDYLFAVLFLDLDGFKTINDSLGHLVGDQFLIAIATRLKVCLRPRDTVARLGGDEFTVLLEELQDISDAFHIADRIHQALSLPFHLDGQEVFTTASMGIALSVGYDRPEDLLRDADTAMYRAKALGRGRYELFNPGMYANAVARLQLETDLRRALDRQEFQVYYQPIVSLTSGRITGFEALIRWQHPERGLVSPLDFIPVAEETGLIVAIGYWVLHEACLQMQAWRVRHRSNSLKKISVNLSIKQFSQPDLIEQIVRILHQTSLDASSLVLEITESVIMENSDRTTTLLLQLQNLGIKLSIDDFGTGYSSLGRLHSFPIHGLKIDRSFVSPINSNGRNLEIIETIVTLAQKLGCEVTAEGVETASQLALLRWLNCEYGQGYFFSHPLDSLAAEALIITNPLW
ncbi:EAL domain-containing protein [Scytonema sp. NUACC26]|uniref:EAL domain-containing protein n=1 Tax=Scytonema sp. NUACC26 TaxID=3140176 RepID=UPI0034DC0570